MRLRDPRTGVWTWTEWEWVTPGHRPELCAFFDEMATKFGLCFVEW